MRTRTIILIILSVLVVGALSVVAFRADPVPVDLATVTRAPMQVTVDVEGKTRITEIYEVAAPIRGTARRSPVRVGDEVTEGETVVAIVEPAASDPLDPRSRIQAEAIAREAESGLHLARSTLRQAEEELDLAQSEHDRAKELVSRGVSSFTRLENAEQALAIRQAAMQAAVSNLEMAKSTLDRARAALLTPASPELTGEDCCLEITAPTDGQVLEIDTISERPVFSGARLLSIGHPDTLEIVADVLSTDAVRLSLGNLAFVERWGGPDTLTARVEKIEPSAFTKVSALGIEEQRVDVILELTDPDDTPTRLGHGFTVFLRIVEWEAADVLQTPLSSMFRHDNRWAVFVSEDGRARRRYIDVGRTTGLMAEIVGGVSEGDEVIMHPNVHIQDGTAIRVRD